MAEKKFVWKKIWLKKNLAEKKIWPKKSLAEKILAEKIFGWKKIFAEKILADVLAATPTQYTTAASSSFVKKLHKNSFFAHTHAQFDSNSI